MDCNNKAHHADGVSANCVRLKDVKDSKRNFLFVVGENDPVYKEGVYMSWKAEVLVQGEWSTNAVRFATKEEAEEAGKELLSRWFVPVDSRAAESNDPVNYRFDFEAYKPVRLEENQDAIN